VSQPDTNICDGITRQIWMLMLEQGGRWTSTELARKVGISNEKAGSLVYFMLRSGTVRRVRSGARKNGVAFVVTNECMVPRDMKLGDLLNAAGIRIWDADERKAA
jgi:DNA-binding Lrp family transcriptional regulator